MYTLHITRKSFWAEPEGENISEIEYMALPKDPYIQYKNGNLYTINPNEDYIQKMKEIANKLNAKVQGDDGEEY